MAAAKTSAWKEQWKNNEGYFDPTQGLAFQNIDKEDDTRFRKLLNTIFYLCELAGFEIEGRIVLVDKKSGKVWR